MRPCAVAALLFGVATALAAAPSNPAVSQEHRQPSELVRLEKVLDRAQEAQRQGSLAPERYSAFLIEFRVSLDKAWEHSPRTPAETAAHSRILARLGDSDRAQAEVSAALKQDPDNPDLRLARGDVALERKDFAGALAEADTLLKRDPHDQRALALKHFAEGRVSVAPAGGSSSALDVEQAVSVLGDPRVVMAARRAEARKDAIHFTGEASDRLKIGDPAEALRLLALAEASDPSLADVPMQQGLAYMDLRRPREAAPRFAKAQELWMAEGNKEAATARAFEEQAAAQDAGTLSRKAATPAAPESSDPRRKTLPLGGAAAGFILAGLGASLMKEDDDDQWRKPLLIASFAGIGLLGGGLLGYAGYMLAAPTLAGGATLALAGGGTVGGETALVGSAAAAAGGAGAGGVVGAKAGADADAETAERDAPRGRSTARNPGPSPVPAPLPNTPLAGPDEGCSQKPEELLANFVDGTRLAPGYLHAHERQGGHTISRHVETGSDYLEWRLNDVESASSFISYDIAEEAIRAAVLGNRTEIESWFRSGLGKQRDFAYPSQRRIGYSVSRARREPVAITDVVVVLRRIQGCRILIYTAYPKQNE